MTISVPQSIEEVTPEWISAATGWNVTDLHDRTDRSGHWSLQRCVSRWQLTGQGCPASIVVKQPALDPAAVFTSTMLRMYIREVRYFTTLAPLSSTLRSPAFYLRRGGRGDQQLHFAD
jgi:hypothetical protein